MPDDRVDNESITWRRAIELQSLNLSIALSDIYEDVTFERLPNQF